MKNNVGLLLTKRAQLNPQIEGFVDVDTNRRFTFAEWNKRSNRTANFLLDLGIEKGDRVALLMMNSVEYMESFFAIAKIGAVCVPLNWRLTVAELQFIVQDAGARAMVFGGEFADSVTELRDLGSGDDGTEVEHWVHVGATAQEAAPDWARSYNELQAAVSDDEPEANAEDDDLLYIMYTSGTTGLPKGAVHTHDTAMWGVLTINATADVRQGDRYLLSLPLFHVGALTPATSSVHVGATSVVMRQFDPVRVWQLVESEKINLALKVPAMLNFMLQVRQQLDTDFSTLRYFQSGAAPVPVSLIRAYEDLGIEIQQVYGLTETCGPACLITGSDALERAGSTGKAFFHTEVRVIDDHGNDVAPGDHGEVIVRGRHIMKGYWKRPEATAEVIQGDGWFHTGDGATVDEDGFVYIQDRIKDMYISGGENVYPAEIENVLAGHPGVVEAGVIGVPSERWGESGLAIVVRKDDSVTEEDLLAYCSDKLARYKQPRLVKFIEQIPRNPSGKILKRVLREQFPEAAPE